MNLEDYFQQPEFTTPYRLILSVEGMQKVGKTTLGLTALEQGPLAMLDYDFGGEGILSNFDQSKIWHLPLRPPSSMLLDKEIANAEYDAAWKLAKDAYYAALADPRVKTILIDTATEFRESQILGHFGKLAQIIPRWYAGPNAEMRKIIRDAYERPDLNLILLHSMKDEYVNDVNTGKKRFSGFSGVPSLMQMVVRLWKQDGQYGLTIIDSRHKRSLEGTTLPSAVATFPMLLKLVHGGE